MGWIKLDENFFLHRKAVAAGRDGRDLFIAALCWSNQQRTDGVIPAPMLAIIGALAGVPDVERAASTLVDVGLWRNDVDGWVAHDFLEYQQSRESREAWLEKDRDRKRAARDAKLAEALANVAPMAPRTPKRPEVSENVRADSAVVPRNVRSRDVDVDLSSLSCSEEGTSSDCETPQPGSGKRDPLYRWDDFWDQYPRRNGRRDGKSEAKAMWQRMTYEQKAEAFKAEKHYAHHCETSDQFPMDARRFLRKRTGRPPEYAEWVEYTPPADATTPATAASWTDQKAAAEPMTAEEEAAYRAERAAREASHAVT